MKPGATTRPRQSIVCRACAPANFPTAAMQSPLTATSAAIRAAPVPSMTVPPENKTSYKETSMRFKVLVLPDRHIFTNASTCGQPPFHKLCALVERCQHTQELLPDCRN